MTPVLPELKQTSEKLRAIFDRCSDIVFREFKVSSIPCLLIHLSNNASVDRIEDHILNTLPSAPILDGVEVADSIEQVTDQVLQGNAVLLLEGKPYGMVYLVSDGPSRGIQEPQSESVIRGPREGFTERIGVNLSLLRNKIRSPHLKTIKLTLGEKTRTKVVLAYLADTANPDMIAEVERRLRAVRIDSVLETGYLEEMIEDTPYSPFPQHQYTERPDTAAAQLLDGRFAILVDGTPFVLTGPVVFWQFFQSSEDYYERFTFSNMLLWLRMAFLFIALFTPALYIAITTFHQDMLPTNLILSIAAARESIPFPALVEALIMEVSFEALREAGIRLPKAVGQAVSILGALVIGQAAVQAGIVSAPMVIVVSLTGIASFTIPRFNFAIAIRLLRFPLMIMAGLFGLFGIIIATLLIAVHICGLQSYGVPFLSGLAPLKISDLKDTLIRTPWFKMKKLPASITGRSRANRLTESYQEGEQP